ncbi:hypothetical protein EYF80_059461 [Liparis tanakae]|uniref:Uncharacterized protein n=1 Tax=Liparis tanakae TaxID=230148 RepID=A0A4Z2EN75_9TELE|nr:hypothetical protein EYF80_059461 [Liparis tanakae]
MVFSTFSCSRSFSSSRKWTSPSTFSFCSFRSTIWSRRRRRARPSMCVSSSHSSRFFRDRSATSEEASILVRRSAASFSSRAPLLSCRYSICGDAKRRRERRRAGEEPAHRQVQVGDQLLVAGVLSLQGDDVVRPPAAEGAVHALDLLVPLLHLKREQKGKNGLNTVGPERIIALCGPHLGVEALDELLSVGQVQLHLHDLILQLHDPVTSIHDGVMQSVSHNNNNNNKASRPPVRQLQQVGDVRVVGLRRRLLDALGLGLAVLLQAAHLVHILVVQELQVGRLVVQFPDVGLEL